MTVIRNVQAEVELEEALRVVEIGSYALLQAQQSELLNPFPSSGDTLKFSDLCLLYVFARFVEAGIHVEPGEEFSGPEMCARLALGPMLSFAGEVARARYDVRGHWVGTTHPDHVPERYIIHSGNAVCRVGSLAAYESRRRESSDRAPTMFVFDAKVAAEHLVDAIRRAPYEVVIGDAASSESGG